MFEHMNDSMDEFVAYNKQRDESDVMPTSLKNYDLGLQRAFKIRYGYHITVASGKEFSNYFMEVLA